MSQAKNKLLLFFLFISVIAASAFFRIQNLHLIEFKADEGINLFLATRPLFGHAFPPIGIISSAGIPNPPFFNYLMLPIVYTTTDPKAISFIIGSINSLAIGLFFLLVYKYYSLPAALPSSVLIALSPWSILFSRKIWPPDFILPFMVAILYSLHKIVIDKKDFFWLPYTVFSLFLIQLYHPTTFFVFSVTAFLLIQKMKPHIGYIAAGIFLGILPLLPYLFYQLQNGCADCSTFLRIREKLALRNSTEMFLRPMQIIGQGNFQFILGSDMHTFASNYPFAYQVRKLLYFPYLILPLSMALFWKRNIKLRFLVYATTLLPIFYFFIRLEPFMHYFAVIIPILFIFIGVGFSAVFSSKVFLVKLFFFFLFIALLIAYGSFNSAFFDLLSKQKMLAGDYGTSFSQTEKFTKEHLFKYKNDKHYKEMTVASYVQRGSIVGNQTLAKAVYNQKKTARKINQLDQQLKKVPADSSVENELLAYYTLLPKTPKTMEMLREKTIQNQYYHNIYEEIYKHYLSFNLKNVYRGSDFSLEYPGHWKKIDLPSGGLMLKVDNFYMVVARDDLENNELDNFWQDEGFLQKTYNSQKIKILEQDIQRMECVKTQNLWCGVGYNTISIKEIPYKIFYQSELAKSQPPGLNDKKLNEIVKEMDLVVNSIRESPL